MRRRLAGWLAVGMAGALATASAAASATPSSKLTYLRGPGAEQCPDESALRKAVATRLGYDPFFAFASRTVVAEIGRSKGQFHAGVRIVDAHGVVRGERALASTSEDCGEMISALALAISIAIDDFEVEATPAVGDPSSTSPAPEASPEVPAPAIAPADRPAPPPDVAGAPPAAPPLSFQVWSTPVASFGAAPAASLGLQAGFEARFRRFFSLGLEGRADLDAGSSVLGGAHVTTRVVLGSLAACVRVSSPLFSCGLASLGNFHESGSGVRRAASGDAVFAALGARVGVALPVATRFLLLAHADALATLTRHLVQIDGQKVFEVWPVTVSLGIGAGITF